MAAQVVFRSLGRQCVVGRPFGCLRVNGLYWVPSQVASPTSQALVPFQKSQVQVLSTSVVSRAAPEIEQAGHDHVLHWTAERILTVVLLGTIPLAVVYPTPTVEYFLALSLTVHSHWGIEAIVVDYVRPSIFGKIIPKLAVGSVYLLSFFTLGGLCYFIYTDVGIVNAVKLLWKL